MEYCRVCFLKNHTIETCKAIPHAQQILARGMLNHAGYDAPGHGYIISGGVYNVNYYVNDMPKTVNLCNIKFLQFCHEFNYVGYENLVNGYLPSSKNSYAFKWFLSRYPHFVELNSDGEYLATEAFRCAYPTDFRPAFSNQTIAAYER